MTETPPPLPQDKIPEPPESYTIGFILDKISDGDDIKTYPVPGSEGVFRTDIFGDFFKCIDMESLKN